MHPATDLDVWLSRWHAWVEKPYTDETKRDTLPSMESLSDVDKKTATSYVAVWAGRKGYQLGLASAQEDASAAASPLEELRALAEPKDRESVDRVLGWLTDADQFDVGQLVLYLHVGGESWRMLKKATVGVGSLDVAVRSIVDEVEKHAPGTVLRFLVEKQNRRQSFASFTRAVVDEADPAPRVTVDWGTFAPRDTMYGTTTDDGERVDPIGQWMAAPPGFPRPIAEIQDTLPPGAKRSYTLAPLPGVTAGAHLTWVMWGGAPPMPDAPLDVLLTRVHRGDDDLLRHVGMGLPLAVLPEGEALPVDWGLASDIEVELSNLSDEPRRVGIYFGGVVPTTGECADPVGGSLGG